MVARKKGKAGHGDAPAHGGERVAAALEAYNKSDPKDEKLFEVYTGLEDEADHAFRGCYADEALNAPFYKDLVKEAQAIVNALPR